MYFHITNLISVCCFFFFFFNDTATTEIYTLSLHDALPICGHLVHPGPVPRCRRCPRLATDRTSTRLNSSHQIISYAVFCLKKKKNTKDIYYKIKKKKKLTLKIKNTKKKK